MLKWFAIVGMLFVIGCASNPETESERYPDVKVTRLLRIIDGDTFVCDIDELSSLIGKNIRIRLKHIDTPELRDKDPEKRQAAQVEKQRLTDLLTRANLRPCPETPLRYPAFLVA